MVVLKIPYLDITLEQQSARAITTHFLDLVLVDQYLQDFKILVLDTMLWATLVELEMLHWDRVLVMVFWEDHIMLHLDGMHYLLPTIMALIIL